MTDEHRRALGVEQLPDMFTLRHTQIHTGQHRQIGRIGRHAVNLKQAWTGHQTLTAIGQHPQHQIAVRQWRRPHPNGNIDPLADHIDRPVGFLKMNRHARISHHEGRDHRPHAGIKQGHRTSHSHHAARLGLRQCNRLIGGIGLDQHGLAMHVIGLASLGDRKTAGRALQQAHTEPLFQQGQPTTEA